MNSQDNYCPEVSLNENSQKKRVLQHSVMLRSGRRKGAGIILDESENYYTVVTAKHVITPNNEVMASRYSKENDSNSLKLFPPINSTSRLTKSTWNLGEVVWQHPSEDIAILKFLKSSTLTTSSSMYTCMLSKEFSKDASIYHVGYRGNGWDVSQSPGEVADVEDFSIAFKSHDFLRGQSGGPILNDAWQIIGMGISAPNSSYNIALRIDYVLSEVGKYRSSYLSKYTIGIPSQDMKFNTAKHDSVTLISTLLNDYYFKTADLVAVLERGGVTAPEIDPTYQGREQKYNIAHDELVNRHLNVRETIAQNWDKRALQEYDEIFIMIRGVSNNPKVWNMGDKGVHSVIYNGLEHAIGLHNENNGEGAIPRWTYSAYLDELNLQMPMLRNKIDSLLDKLN